MSDSGKSPIGGTLEDIGESVAKPVIDIVGDIAQEVIGSVVPGINKPATTKPRNPTPNFPDVDPSKINQQDQTKLTEARWKIEQLKKTEAEIAEERKKREEREQARLQSQQQEVHQDQAEEEQKQQEQNQAIVAAQTAAENKGKGVGG